MTQTPPRVPTKHSNDAYVMLFDSAPRLIKTLRSLAPNDPATASFIELERVERANHPYPRFGAFYIPATLAKRVIEVSGIPHVSAEQFRTMLVFKRDTSSTVIDASDARDVIDCLKSIGMGSLAVKVENAMQCQHVRIANLGSFALSRPYIDEIAAALSAV